MKCQTSRLEGSEAAGRRPWEWRWWLSGTVVVACHVGLLFVSFRFGQERPLIERPVLLLVGLELIAGVAWLAAVWPPAGMRASRGCVVVMLAVGAILRGLMLPSTPILEDDFYRYLWDGAVVAHGHSPYARAPQEFMDPGGAVPAEADGLRTLARDGQAVLARINHPSLRTIYPPVAQGAFALAHGLAPWSLMAWRGVLLLFDAATVALLLLLLRRLARSPLWAAIYWWNPLLVLHGVNGAHMDLLALPFVLGAVLLALRGRQLWGIACMAIAAGVKLWPVILLPFLESISQAGRIKCGRYDAAPVVSRHQQGGRALRQKGL